MARFIPQNTHHNPESKINLDKTPYIIHVDEPRCGLFANFIAMLGGIAFADEHNFIPVVDMKNYPSTYLYDDELGKVNAWEYYFEQPGNVSLEDAMANKIYVESPNSFDHRFPEFIRFFYYNHNGELDYWRRICKKYIRFKPAVLEKLATLEEKTKGKRVLGVSIRGTDYVALRLKTHPVQPSPEEAIAKAQEVLSEKKFDVVYLTCEDKRIVKKFQEAFGEKLITLERDYINFDYNSDKWVTLYVADRENDKYLRGLEYLVAMLFLTKCQGVITSMTSGSAGTMCLSEGFEYFYVFDLGVY